MRNPAKIALAVVAICLMGPVGTTVLTAELGDIDAGLQFAGQHCAECHDITSRNPMSTASGAPSFATVAKTPGMSRTPLVVWMQTSHPEMPDLVLAEQDLDNVIAYILSLGTN